ncbi:SDR family oxidoreductase [Gorillibacterium sp. CAU 1737]|uniref:SDR family NAD(P)-dependent oxidoreductase n=1 Tax=Gorillibacterium sp. CAU 1737 TaxID=3140362 RepID=UPI00325FE944
MAIRQWKGSNKNVLITGASSGIGLELARMFASGGSGLVLVARNEAALERLAEELRRQYDIPVTVMAEDLSDPTAPDRILVQLAERGLRIDALVNNAGAGYSGEFLDIPWERDEQVMQLNMASLTKLTKELVRGMRERKSGAVLNVASTGSYQPGPLTAVYYASKAYVLSLTLALRRELEPYGISVSALCPGATRTAFSERAGKQDQPGAMSPERVARIGYDAFCKGKAVIVPGFGNKAAVAVSCLLPGTLLAGMVYRIQERVLRK